MQYLTGLSIKDPDEVRTIFLVFFMVFEPLRLAAGYRGNLREQVLPLRFPCRSTKQSNNNGLELMLVDDSADPTRVHHGDLDDCAGSSRMPVPPCRSRGDDGSPAGSSNSTACISDCFTGSRHCNGADPAPPITRFR